MNQLSTSTAKPKRRGNLRDKVAMYFLAVSVVPILAMGFIVVYLVDVTSERTIKELETQLVRQKTEEIAKFFEETAGVFDLRIPIEIADIAVVPASQREHLLRGTLAESRAIKSVSFFDLAGSEIGRVERARDLVPERELIDGHLLEKFTVAKSGAPYFSPIRYTLEGTHITIAYPLKNSADAVVGVLAGDVSLKPLERAVSFGVLGNTGYVLLIAENGDVVAGSLHDISAHPNLASTRVIEQLRGNGNVSRANESAVERYANFWGEDVFGYGERVRSLPFMVVAEWPQDDALRLAREIRTQALVFSLFMLVAVFLISMLVARRITLPIRLLQKEARVIGEGRFEEVIPVKTGDELEELDEELHEMAKALKTLHQLREEFVFIAAHELRAPVTAIKGYISMMLEGDAGEINKEVHEMLSQVQKANQHLVQLVQDLLEVARSEAGRMKVEVSPQDLASLSKIVISDLKPLWEEKKLSMTYREFVGTLPPVLADPDKLREVLVNLISNAIKYNRDAGAVELWHEISGNTIVTHVKDTGIGLAPEEQVKLFGKFYRAENAETRKVQGTGLGLFIVKEILEKMGGSIGVASERGKGSTFSFSLPIA